MIASDPAMRQVLALADQVAPLRRLDPDHRRERRRQGGDGPLRPQGLAPRRAARSSRSTAPPSPRTCSESELFGHEKGAFTGALARRVGKFEEADGGTLLLDEISEMDARLQAKLLRALQEREIDRGRRPKPVTVDIRILATSNRDLAQAVRDGTFREDLLYRLNVVNLRLPPLRERPGDILALAELFGRKYAAANGVPDRPLLGRGARAGCSATAGPATSASSRTPCTARCCCRSGPRSEARHPPAGRRAPMGGGHDASCATATAARPRRPAMAAEAAPCATSSAAPSPTSSSS